MPKKVQAPENEAQVMEVVAQNDSEEEETSFIPLDSLQELGINMSDIQKFKEAGFCTVQSVLMAPKKQTLQVKGISEAKMDKISQAALKKCPDFGFQTGNQILQRRQKILKITTGCKALDELLGGGVETASITEAFGEFRTGKTQIAHTLAVTTQMPRDMQGGEGQVIYLDTEGTFRPQRIIEIAERFELDSDAVLDNIIHARPFNHEHQMDLITMAAAKMCEGHFRLLIVDSISALFRVDFSGRGELAERQQKLGQMMSKLIKLAEEYNVGVFITNQVCSDPSGGAMSFVADPKKPVGGHVLAHASTTRLSLRKGKAESRICKIYDSPSLPEAEAMYAISSGGIVDSKE